MPQAEKPSPLVGEGGGEADERGKLEKKRKNRNTCEQNTTTILTCVRTLAPIASQARHFPPSSGEADTKEEKNYSFYFFIYAFDDILCRILRSRSYFIRMFRSFTYAYHRSRMTAGVNYIFEK